MSAFSPVWASDLQLNFRLVSHPLRLCQNMNSVPGDPIVNGLKDGNGCLKCETRFFAASFSD